MTASRPRVRQPQPPQPPEEPRRERGKDHLEHIEGPASDHVSSPTGEGMPQESRRPGRSGDAEH
jgi:hypothetical protein